MLPGLFCSRSNVESLLYLMSASPHYRPFVQKKHNNKAHQWISMGVSSYIKDERLILQFPICWTYRCLLKLAHDEFLNFTRFKSINATFSTE